MYALDILVLSSQWEGLPNVVLEAMAAGKPVVATNVGACAEVVVNGETGWIVPPQNPPALAEAVLRLLKDPELAGTMGRRGRRRVEEHFTVDKMVHRTEAVYEQVLSREEKLLT
jgi:glycosyltransferase involved in cell wall biosynthesis